MKQDDHLKKFIQEHRESFDDERLPPHVFAKITRRTKKHGSGTVQQIGIYAVAAAFAAILIHSIFNKTSAPQEETQRQVAATAVLETPSAQKADEPIQLAEAIPQKPTKQIRKTKRRGNDVGPTTPRKYDPLLTELTGREPVSEKIDAILEASAKETLSDQIIGKLGQLFTHDESSNVRLAALNVLEHRSQQPDVKRVLLTGLSREKDPVIQMELVRLLSNDRDTTVTEKLIELAHTPFTLPEVKDQINFALLTRME